THQGRPGWRSFGVSLPACPLKRSQHSPLFRRKRSSLSPKNTVSPCVPLHPRPPPSIGRNPNRLVTSLACIQAASQAYEFVHATGTATPLRNGGRRCIRRKAQETSNHRRGVGPLHPRPPAVPGPATARRNIAIYTHMW